MSTIRGLYWEWRRRNDPAVRHEWEFTKYLWRCRLDDLLYGFAPVRLCVDCKRVRQVFWWGVGDHEECLPF